MGSNLFSSWKRLCINLRYSFSNGRISETLLSSNAFITSSSSSSRSYYKGRVPRSNLYAKISPLGSPGTSLIPELEKWVEDGKKVSVSELQRIIRDLRKRKRFSQALEVSEWMGDKGVCEFSSSDHAVRLDLVGKVRGMNSAEIYFDTMTDEFKTEKTYGALLNCYARAQSVDKSLTHMQKMKDLGFASNCLSYNDLMCLYTNIGEHEKVPTVLTEMKDNGISPDNFSYRICINSYGTRSDIEGMERVLEEMENQSHIVMDWNTYAVVANIYIKAGLTDKATAFLKKSEEKLDKKDGPSYNHLISLYTALGNKSEVTRLWGLLKAECKRYCNKDYITMIGSLVKLEEFEEAENLFEEWETASYHYDLRVPITLMYGYCQNGMVEKAEALLVGLQKNGKDVSPNIWGVVCAGHVKKGNMEKALSCMKAALKLHEGNEGWRPNPTIIESILRWIGDEGEAQEVETFIDSLKIVIPMNRDMYHALIKSYIRGGKEVDGILKSMKNDEIDENEETKEILSSRLDEEAV